MGEERRFLRGIIPGLIFFVEFCIVFVLLLNRDQIHSIVKYPSKIGTLFSAFIFSGAFGYFLGILYRSCYWTFCQLDFKSIINSLCKNNCLILKYDKNDIVDCEDLNKNGAWRLINEIFYTKKNSALIKGPERRNDRLFDYMHSSGTSLCGIFVLIIIVLICWIFGCFCYAEKTIIGILIILVILIAHLFEYYPARKNARYFLEVILINALNESPIVKPLIIYISKGDIKRKKALKKS